VWLGELYPVCVFRTTIIQLASIKHTCSGPSFSEGSIRSSPTPNIPTLKKKGGGGVEGRLGERDRKSLLSIDDILLTSLT